MDNPGERGQNEQYENKLSHTSTYICLHILVSCLHLKVSTFHFIPPRFISHICHYIFQFFRIFHIFQFFRGKYEKWNKNVGKCKDLKCRNTYSYMKPSCSSLECCFILNRRVLVFVFVDFFCTRFSFPDSFIRKCLNVVEENTNLPGAVVVTFHIILWNKERPFFIHAIRHWIAHIKAVFCVLYTMRWKQFWRYVQD